MKIIVRKLDSVIIYGTNDNETNIEVIDNNFVVNGNIVATNVNEQNYDLIESPLQNLIDPFFVGYTIWDDGFFYSQEYIDFNAKTHNCLQEVKDAYYLKSQDPQYSEEERQSFTDYCGVLDVEISVTYLNPAFVYPTPPDEMSPYIPSCSF
jgi:hypothetical protein